MPLKTDIMEEKQILASFISRLPEAIVICDAEGVILLHDSQAVTYLQPRTDLSMDASSMNGCPITAYVDKALVEHALDEINDQLKQRLVHTVSTFLLQKHSRTLKTQIVPVLNQVNLFAGFVVILDDITQQNQAQEQVESLLKTLSKNARSPMASIRAAIEAMKQFPGMAREKQDQFKDIIHRESMALSDILNSVTEQYAGLIHAKPSLKTVVLQDLLKTVSRRSLDRQEIHCRIQERAETKGVRIKADPYLMTCLLLFLLDRLKAETGLAEFYISFELLKQIVRMDIVWTGSELPPQRLKHWESLDILGPGASPRITMTEVLNQHGIVIGSCTGQEDGIPRPCLRFFIPGEISLDTDRAGPALTLPETRIQLRDLELFDHSDQGLELDNRLLTELTYTALIRDIQEAGQVEEMIGKHSQLPRIIHRMLTSGTRIRTVTWLITAFSDAILNRLVMFAMEELGPPPVPFAFVTLGSEGRKEQTLKTDQDNAIIFADPGEGQTLETLQPYFLKLGETVCTWLDQAGFDFCKGNIMAQNPKWCQPLSVWKAYFSSWIHAASPEDLLHASIFFDFRFAHGDQHLTQALISHLQKSLSNWTGFFRNMAENAVYFKPPIGFFNNFQVQSSGPHKNSLDIKMAGLPIVDFARIYSLEQGIWKTSTQERLYQLYLKKVLSRNEYSELDQAYSFMMQIRFMVQIQAILGQNLKPDNFVNPKQLSAIERKMLKAVLKKIKDIQAKLHFDFIGATDHQST